MTSLHEMQSRCRQAFAAGDTNALSGLLRPDAVCSSAGIGVYQNNAHETFRLALAASYPVIKELAGDECFAGLASSYLASHPSRQPDLQAFGERFPDYLEQCYAHSPHRYLADVARLELATEQVLLDREPDHLDAGRLASASVAELPELRLRVSPAVRLVTSDFPILAIWRMHQHTDSAPVSLDAGPSRVLVLRRSGNAVLRELSVLEYKLAERLSCGEPIGSAFESLSNIGNLAALRSATTSLLGYRVFADIY